MNKEWSELNKRLRLQLKKEESFEEGINTLFELRNQLFGVLMSFFEDLKREDFDKIPFINSDGYENKTIAYSIWHIFRIEDIVAHTLIKDDEEIFFKNDYQKKINSPIITTGNELIKEEISYFSKKLNILELYEYIKDVKDSTEFFLKNLTYEETKQKISAVRRQELEELNVVHSNADWLIDYWCNKNIGELIKMPLSRHWIMHVEACLRIKKKIETK